MTIYLAQNDDTYRAMMTHDPEVDFGYLSRQGGLQGFYLLTPQLPIGIASYILQTLFNSAEQAGRCCQSRIKPPLLSRLLHGGGCIEDYARHKSRQARQILKHVEMLLGRGTFTGNLAEYPQKLDLGDLKARYKEREGNLSDRVCNLGNGERNLGDAECNLGDRDAKLTAAVALALNGRMLFLEELLDCLQENRLIPDESGSLLPQITQVVQTLFLAGKLEISPSLGFVAPGEIRCFRCGRSFRLKNLLFWQMDTPALYRGACPVCSGPSLYCENCNTLGESRLCRALFAIPAEVSTPAGPRGNITLTAANSLTPAQQKAAAALNRLVAGDRAGSCLVWAAPGTGKTEVVLPLVTAALKKGQTVLYSSPRRDVVREILPRLQSAISGVKINAVYGGSPGHFPMSPLIVATTHQVLRYYRSFDLVILDEFDAYPYRANEMLRQAVNRAVKTEGWVVLMTATPDEETLSSAHRGKTGLITIPARYHGCPLPEPVLNKLAVLQKNGRGDPEPAAAIKELLYRWVVEEANQVFVFLPTRKKVEFYSELLQKTVETWPGQTGESLVGYCHAADPQRERKCREFKEGLIRILVTTTIMERGITVNRANVLVLEADCARIFDEGSLIQTAGRAGRTMSCPTGEVVFAAATLSREMVSARNKIRLMNEIARKQGFLKSGGR